LDDLGVDGVISSNKNDKKLSMGVSELDFSGLGLGPVAACCRNFNGKFVAYKRRSVLNS
jgi:hypothetical protein